MLRRSDYHARAPSRGCWAENWTRWLQTLGCLLSLLLSGGWSAHLAAACAQRLVGPPDLEMPCIPPWKSFSVQARWGQHHAGSSVLVSAAASA